MEILNCTVDDSLLDDVPEVLIVQIFEVDGDGDDWGDTGVGGDSIMIDDDDIEGDHTIKDITTHPDRFQVDGNEETGYYVMKRKE